METDGFVLNAAIDLYASATLTPQAGQVVSFQSAVDVRMQHKTWALKIVCKARITASLRIIYIPGPGISCWFKP